MELLPNTLTGQKSWRNNAIRGLDIQDEHGGGCCGIVHLHNFPVASGLNAFGCNDRLKDVTVAQRVEWITKAISEAVSGSTDDAESPECDPGECEQCDEIRARQGGGEVSEAGHTWHCGIEVVLAEFQRPEWEKALKTAGFKMVFDFLNSNSGNRCYIYYHETGKGSKKK